ncbi:nucleotidyltransferase family protein [Gloeobacter morelensis]|uniref:Nucleotidyltransferase family protein n=1 Tax=Gloeobacter morelensis MG652769 TaxID=2781736 RepID=A0ABY3PQA4_9CYAN|nr:nucleotidyltransferase family protein [Gloeobacter morelensis]UFP95866.1 nucleotidyltransferase family protein [Gloeobacter morelensis MG652769]
MDNQVILESLREHQLELRCLGVASLSLFGSVARSEAKPESDIDLLVVFEPEAKMSLLQMISISNLLSDLLKRPVDLVELKSLGPDIRHAALKDQLLAF